MSPLLNFVTQWALCYTVLHGKPPGETTVIQWLVGTPVTWWLVTRWAPFYTVSGLTLDSTTWKIITGTSSVFRTIFELFGQYRLDEVCTTSVDWNRTILKSGDGRSALPWLHFFVSSQGDLLLLRHLEILMSWKNVSNCEICRAPYSSAMTVMMMVMGLLMNDVTVMKMMTLMSWWWSPWLRSWWWWWRRWTITSMSSCWCSPW